MTDFGAFIIGTAIVLACGSMNGTSITVQTCDDRYDGIMSTLQEEHPERFEGGDEHE